jgi:hypothetical protein
MRDTVGTYILSDAKRLARYAELMCRIKDYKRDASVNPLKGGFAAVVNYGMSGLQVERHRIANVQGKKTEFGPDSLISDDLKAQQVRRKDFHGLNLSKAVGADAHAIRPHRFFCNRDHQELFRVHYPTIYEDVRSLERSGVGKGNKNEMKQRLLGEYAAYWRMQEVERLYLDRFLAKRGIDLDG